MKLKAIAFDLDGTFYPYFKMYIHSIPLFIQYPRFMYCFSKARMKMRTIMQIHDFKELQASLLAKYMNISDDRAYLKIQHIIYNEWENVFKRIRPYNYLLRSLKKLKAMGLKLAVLSDYPVKSKLKYLGVDGLWDYTASSEETGYLKPNLKPFLRLSESLGLPENKILYVGDIYSFDIIGAYKAGMKTAYLSRSLFKKKYVDIQFSSYKKFDTLIENYINR